MNENEPTITVDRASFSYGYEVVLDSISLNIYPGEVTSLRGENGSGKSTLLHMIAGNIAPARGSVSRKGRSRPAVVYQRSQVTDELPLTVADCVAIGRYAPAGLFRPLGRTDGRVVRETMERLGLAGLAKRRLRELSGGQRQRALIAQALVQPSDFLLLDEPSTGLDGDAQKLIATLMRERAAQGVTVVQATHLPESESESESDSDRVFVMSQGRLVDQA